MALNISASDLTTALVQFGALLRELRSSSGAPSVTALGADKTIPLARSHIFATLNGKINTPPSWTFVEALVKRCEAAATAKGRTPTVTTDLEEWADAYKKLVRLWDQSRREQRSGGIRGRVLTRQDIVTHVVPAAGHPERRVGLVTGDVRQVRCANVWVNSENTDMEMARVHEFSISAIIRYEGATHDAQGRIADDAIADELAVKVAQHRPLEPGSVVITGAGQLRRNGVRHVIHVAAVHGEPGSGFRPMREIGRCVGNALHAAEQLEMPAGERIAVLFPLLGSGTAGGDLDRTATMLIHAARNYLQGVPVTRIAAVYFLAHTDRERLACERALRTAGLSRGPNT